MNNHLQKLATALFLTIGLSGCATGIVVTDLDEPPIRKEDADILGSLGYVIHDTKQDARSWIDALSGFADMGNIFFAEEGVALGTAYSFEDFAKTHAVVHIHVNEGMPVRYPHGMDTPQFLVSHFSLGLIPAYAVEPRKVEFRLSKTGIAKTAEQQWKYSYERKNIAWFLLLPAADFIYSLPAVAAELDSDWRVKEKRRLLLKFLKDAGPELHVAKREKSF